MYFNTLSDGAACLAVRFFTATFTKCVSVSFSQNPFNCNGEKPWDATPCLSLWGFEPNYPRVYLL
jgi:hypothetical protein